MLHRWDVVSAEIFQLGAVPVGELVGDVYIEAVVGDKKLFRRAPPVDQLPAVYMLLAGKVVGDGGDILPLQQGLAGLLQGDEGVVPQPFRTGQAVIEPDQHQVPPAVGGEIRLAEGVVEQILHVVPGGVIHPVVHIQIPVDVPVPEDGLLGLLEIQQGGILADEVVQHLLNLLVGGAAVFKAVLLRQGQAVMGLGVKVDGKGAVGIRFNLHPTGVAGDPGDGAGGDIAAAAALHVLFQAGNLQPQSLGGGLNPLLHLLLSQAVGDAGGAVGVVAEDGQGGQLHALMPGVAVGHLGEVVVDQALEAHAGALHADFQHGQAVGGLLLAQPGEDGRSQDGKAQAGRRGPGHPLHAGGALPGPDPVRLLNDLVAEVVQCVADVFRFHKNPSCSRCFFNPCRARYNRLFTLDWLMP